MKEHLQEFWPVYKALLLALGFFVCDIAVLLLARAAGYHFTMKYFLAIDVGFLIACGYFLYPYTALNLEFKKETRYSNS